MFRSLILALVTAVTIAGPAPQRIFFTRVFPAPGELGLFIANADGTGNIRCSRRRTSTTSRRGRLTARGSRHIRAEWIGRHLSRPSGWIRSRTADRQSCVRRSSSLLARWPAARLCDDMRRWHRRSLDARRSDAPRKSGHLRAGRRFPPGVVARWPMDRLLSDRTTGLPFSHGRWEALHVTDIYLIHPDGSGVKRITDHTATCAARSGRPTVSA